jgi:hypothetical protein
MVNMRKNQKDEKQSAERPYSPNDEEKKVLDKIFQRKKDMQIGRTQGETNWEEYWDDSDKAYNAKTETLDSDDWRSNLHIPIEFSIVETVKQESMEQTIRWEVEPGDPSDIKKVPFMNEVIDASLDKMKWNATYFILNDERYRRGTTACKITYRREKRKIYDMVDYDDVEDKESYEENEIYDYDDVLIKYIDLFDLYIDEAVRDIADAKDVIEREVMSIETFHKRYDSKYKNAKKVKAGGEVDAKSYYVPPEDITDDKVEVLHYWNKPDDKYAIVANGVLVRNLPNPYAHKKIPYRLLYCYRNSANLYGFSIPMLIKHIVDEINTLRNMRINFQHMSIDKMFIVSDQLGIDEEDLMVRPHGMIEATTTSMPLQNSIMALEYGDVKPSSMQDIEMLMDDVRRTIGVDDRLQGVIPQSRGTATEAAILKEATLKRVRMLIKYAEIDGLKDIGELLVATISQYYEIPRVKKIVGEDGEEREVNEYKSIRIKDKEVVPTQDGFPEIQKGEGYDFFEANPDMIRGNYDIKVVTSSVPHVSKPLQQAKLTEMFTMITQNPLWQGLIDPKKSLEMYVRTQDENPQEILKAALNENEEKDLALQENERMMQGEALPPTPNISENHTAIHIEATQNSEFQVLPPEMQEIFDQHIMGENEQHQGGQIKPSSMGRPALAGPQEPDLASQNQNMGG